MSTQDSTIGTDQPACETHDAGSLKFPVIRIRHITNWLERGLFGLFHGHEIFAITGNDIVLARRVIRPILEEDDCTEGGFESYLGRCHFVKRFRFDQISDACVEGRIKVGIFGRATPETTVDLKMQVRRRDQRITLNKHELPNVCTALSSALGPAFDADVRWLGPWGNVTCCLFLLWPLALSLGVFGILRAFEPAATGIGDMLAGLIVSLFVLAVAAILIGHSACRLWLSWRPLQFPVEALTAESWPPSGSRVAHREPFRSVPAGWILKMIGVAWLAAAVWYFPSVLYHADAGSPERKLLEHFEIPLFLALIPSAILLHLGAAIAQHKVRVALDRDPRRHLLYLRSFSVDGRTTLQPTSLLASYLGVSTGSLTSLRRFFTAGGAVTSRTLLGAVHPLRLLRLFVGVTADTAEQSFVRYFRELGPIIAIGKPGERVAEIGAYREHVSDDVWQDVVLERLRECQGIIIQPAQSAGMAWELKTVFTNCPPERVVVVLADAPNHANDYEDLCTRMAPFLRGRLPRCAPYRGRPVVIWFERDSSVRWTEVSYKSPAVWLFTGNAVDLEYTLRPFVQGMHGGERERPRPVRKYPWYHHLIAWGCAAICLMAFGTWLVSGRPSGSEGTTSTAAVGPRRLLVGKTVNYSLTIPANWQPQAPNEPLIEHKFAVPDQAVLLVVATAGQDDPSNIAESRRAAMQSTLGANGTATAERVGRLQLDGRLFVRCRLNIKMRDGSERSETTVAYSGAEGTLLIIVAQIGRENAELQHEIDAIYASLKFASVPVATVPSGGNAQMRSRTITGKAVPYSITVPVAWRARETTGENVEHELMNSGRGLLKVIANADHEDLSDFTATLYRGERASVAGKGTAELDSSGKIQINGRDFVRAQITFKMNDGTIMREIAIAHSGHTGTVAVTGVLVGMQISPEQEQELEEILQSVHIGKPAEQ